MSSKNEKEQLIEITLEQYLEYQELLNHKKEVKISTYNNYYKNGKEEWYGSAVSWKSDGKCWYYLTEKLNNAGRHISELVTEKHKLFDKLKEINKKRYLIFNYWKIRKEIKSLLKQDPRGDNE